MVPQSIGRRDTSGEELVNVISLESRKQHATLFRESEPFDWYQRYAALKEFIVQYVRKGDAVLVSGCGNSSKGMRL